MKVAIIGSRSFSDERKFNLVLSKILNDYSITMTYFVSGGAKGPDSFGEKVADFLKIPKNILKPDWEAYGKRAGFLRNIDIADDAEIVIAFWDGLSKGTKHSIDYAVKEKKIVIIYNYDENKLSIYNMVP